MVPVHDDDDDDDNNNNNNARAVLNATSSPEKCRAPRFQLRISQSGRGGRGRE
jgi:hypothetical protein